MGTYFEIWQDGHKVASSTNEGHARHYALMYSMDGGVTELKRKDGRKRTILVRYANFVAQAKEQTND